MISRRTFHTASAALAASAALHGPRALAQGNGKIARVVVGFTAGGSTDAVARLLADKLRGGYAPTIVVENKAGAGARIAAEYVKNAEPDGSTMFLTPDAIMYLYPHFYKTLAYNVFRDFTPVTRASKTALSLFAGPGLPDSVRTVVDYVNWAKANPKAAIYATAGAGATVHFTGVMIGHAAGVELAAVHYKGAAPAIQELMGGQIPMFIGGIGDGLQQVKSGRIRSLGTTGATRSPFLPDVPTLVEQGYKDLVVVEGFGIYVPVKTPAAIVAKLHVAIRDLLKDKDVVDRLGAFGFEPGGETPEEFAKIVRAEYDRWAPVVKASGFKVDE